MKRILRKDDGFTLVEMLIVLMIISLLLVIAIPNLSRNSEVAAEKSCDATIKLLQTQVYAYEIENNEFPTSLSVLKDEGYVDTITCPNNQPLTIDDDGIVNVSQ